MLVKNQSLKSNYNKISIKVSQKKGNIYIKSTRRNIFCSLMDTQEKKIKTSCSLRVTQYNNEFNERENHYKRGILLGELFGDKILELGYTEVAIFLDLSTNKGRKGVVNGLSKKKIKISFLQLSKDYPHNGCRPSKVRRKKVRTKLKI